MKSIRIYGAFVVCERKPEDFPEYGLWWVDIDDLIAMSEGKSHET
ncbi:hypothetical protein YDYSG_56900 [Paenibacillus tyrfis]|nr:hypothetical protein [Paenibacillus tyrfis]GLI09658.1 hypothetical protein YDYSG_56900 [Paenibacillus tyrfis]